MAPPPHVVGYGHRVGDDVRRLGDCPRRCPIVSGVGSKALVGTG